MKTAGKSYRKGRFFYRILFPFIAITSAAAILLSLFFYRQYEIRYRQSISQTGNDQIEGVSQSFGALTRQMRQIYDAIAVEGDITDFLALQEEDSQAGYHAYTALNRIIMTNSDIYLAALCNGWSGQVLLCGSDTLPTDRAMQLLKAWTFEDLKFHRGWLDCKDYNARALHLYESEGLQREGLIRETILTNGIYENLVVLGILDREYAARKQAGFELESRD